jgi:hypothetical protein
MNTRVARLLMALCVLLSTPVMAHDLSPWLEEIEQKVQAHFLAPQDADENSRVTLQAWLL